MSSNNPFLKTLAENLYKEYGESISEVCIVFPNRRSGLFFKKYLASAAAKTMWSPQIVTISEFMQHMSDLQPADPVDLVFEVYGSYRECTGLSESLDEFWTWGEMMIADFDDIDKYVVDAASIYQNIHDLKEIDSHFELTEEQKQTIRKFWGFFLNAELSEQKESFLKIWKLLHKIYLNLNSRLRSKGLAYEGMIYREVAENISAGFFPDLPWQKVIIVGFNALNKAERELFRHLRKSGKGRFFWDYDTYYVNDGVREAGRFMRLNLEEFPPDTKLEDFDNIHSREVNIYELPSDITQVKYLNTLLQKENSSDLVHFSHTALILGDEDLLIPVLTSMPENVEEINITMGYPLSSTPVYSFVDQLLKLQKNIASHRGKRKDKFYFRDVLSILNHQYLKLSSEEKINERIQEIHNKNLIYIDPSFFNDSSILRLIFSRVDEIHGLPDYLREVLLEVARLISSKEQDLHNKLEKEYIFHLITRLNKLKDIFGRSEQIISIEIFTRVFRKIIRNLRIPFEGEPLAGLQIMGILESRLLDFKNLVFLSMNDGIMPRAHQAFSYIPHNLRYAYGMPTREDQDAIYAYYFFRLLQRASKISLFYNSKSDGYGSGEKSRYIQQLLYDSRFITTFKSIGFNIASHDAMPVSILKTPQVFKTLEKYSHDSVKYLSPSALNTYISCRLRFYFSYIAGLRELDTISEEIEADTFGTLLHEAMYANYAKFEGKIIKPSDFDSLLDTEKLKITLDNAFRKVYLKSKEPDKEVVLEGKNIIVYEVLKTYMRRILEIDKNDAPFEILSLEKEYSVDHSLEVKGRIFTIRLGGKIDRVDNKNGAIRIIDYKTGHAKTTYSSIDKLFERDNSKNNKAVFQLLFYSWLFSKNNDVSLINPGLYITRELFKNDFTPLLKMDKEDLNFIPVKNEFEEYLQQMLSEMMDDSVPFDQTEILKNCEYCPYAEICHRKVSEKY